MLQLFLVCDMACLVKLLGLYDVFKPNATFKCPWCEVDCTKIHKFDIKEWKLRDIIKMTETATKYSHRADSTRDKHASSNAGLKVRY